MNSRGDLWVGGRWLPGSGKRFVSTDPATGERLWQGSAATANEVKQALDAARDALRIWTRTPLDRRRAVVLAFRDAVVQRRTELGELIARETGKPRWEAEAEAGAMAAKVDVSLRAHEQRTGFMSSATPFGRAVLRHRAHGVMAVVGPFNFPGHLPNGHIVPALIAGNTVVFKPSELTPAVGEAMAAIWEQVGLPAGVVNLVQGGRLVGEALLDPERVDGVLFTGSARTGSLIHRAFGGHTHVILALEMGGNNPLVAWNPADTRAAATLIVQSAFVTAGQRCSCARRLIVPQGPAGDRVVEAAVALARRARIGPWNATPAPFMGPLITRDAADRTLAAQTALVSAGARAVLSSHRVEGLSGAFLTPGIIELGQGQAPDEEVFGPLLTVARARDFEHALGIANGTRFGLAAGLIADDPALWDAFRVEVRAGVANWNRPTTGAASTLPFGGPGASGNHRPGAWYAADYCAYPVASQEADAVVASSVPGLDPDGEDT